MATKISPLLVIVGETASGKTALGIALAKKFDGEIIAADSRTVYRHMDIGTAKPTKAEQAEVPHHLIDIVDPNQRYNVAQFQRDANKHIEQIAKRGKLPIIVGGTGLYVDAVIFDYNFDNKSMSDLRPNTLVIGIKRSKDDLKSRINARIDTMIEEGFIDEVKRIGEEFGWETEAMKGIGYRAFADYIHGKIDLGEAKRCFARGDLLLAKRQTTWFKRNKSIQWVDAQSKAVEIATTFLRDNE